MPLPLAGIRVLDLSQFLSGPRCTQILALLGADVIKVEAPSGETMRILMTLTASERALSTIHQNKRGIVVDLKTAEGRAVLLDLARASDVLVENLAPGTLDAAGLGWEDAKAANPRLVYASISGFGKTGPHAGRMAFDIIAQATGGIMSANGAADRPPGVFFGDLGAGAYAAIGILAALRARDATGAGTFVDVSMQDVMYFHNYWGFSEKANAPARDEIASLFGRPVTKLLTDPESPMPFWNSYRATDGHVAVVALTDRQWDALLRVVGRADLIGDERFANLIGRIRNCRAGLAAIEAWTGMRTVAEIVSALTAAKVPCGAVAGFEEVGNDPHLAARGMFERVEHARLGTIEVPGLPLKLGGAETASRTPCPGLGQHTEEVLREVLGYDAARIASLREAGAIA